MRFFFILFFCIFYYTISAQVVNIENKRIYDDTVGWSGSIGASFSAVKNQVLLINTSLRPLVQ